MSRAILNEVKYSQLCAEAVSLANAVLNGAGDYLANISKLNDLRFKIGENDFDEDFKIFIVISSDTDHMPYESVREHCSEEWLAKCDKELSELKKFYRGQIEEACKSIISRFSKNA